MPTGADYVKEAREWIGTPFVHASMEKGIGCDCFGLITGVARRLGLQMGEVPVLSHMTVDLTPFRPQLAVWAHPIPVEDPEAWHVGDVLFLRIKRVPIHTAIWTGEGTFIHAYTSAGMIAESVADPAWLDRVVWVYRWKELLS